MSYPPPNYPQQPHPQQSVTKYRRQTKHAFHLLMCWCTCWTWFPVWMCVWAWNAWGPKAKAYTQHR